jgi:hypothetical protein
VATGSVAFLSPRRTGFWLRPCQSTWDLWWTKRHWDRVFSEFLGFPLSTSFHRGSSYSYTSFWTNSRPVACHSSVISSRFIFINISISMAQAVSRRDFTAETRFQTRVCPCGFCDGINWYWERFFSELFCFPLSISFHRCSPHSCITWRMNSRLVGRNLETVSPHDMKKMKSVVTFAVTLSLLID